MSIKAYNKDKQKFVKIASNQSSDIAVNKSDFVSDNVDDALSEIKRQINNLRSNVAWIYNNGTIGGGGGGGSTDSASGSIIVDNFDSSNNLILQNNEEATITFKIQSKLTQEFTVNINVGSSITKKLTVQPNKSNTVNLGILSKGSYTVTISATDYTGYALNNWKGNIIVDILSISAIDISSINYEMNQGVSVLYTVSLSDAVKDRPITVKYTLDGIEKDTFTNVTPNVQNTIVVNESGNIMKLGYHEVIVTASIPDSLGIGNIVASTKVTFLVQSNRYISFYVSGDTSKSYSLGTVVRIPFGIVANTNIHQNFYYTATIKKGNQIVETLNVSSLIYNSSKYIVLDTTSEDSIYRQNGEATYTLSMTGGVVDSEVVSINDNPIFEFKLTDSGDNFTPWNVEQNGLVANFDAKSQLVGASTSWKNSVEGSNITCQLFNCNGENTGFVQLDSDNNKSVSPDTRELLALYGESYAKINYRPFDQLDTETGLGNKTDELTVSFIYKYEQNGDPDSCILSCAMFTEDTLYEGLYLTADKIQSNYGGQLLSTYNVDDEWINCSYVFQSIEGGKKLLKIYLNGVMSACVECDNSSKADKNIEDIYIGCRHKVSYGQETIETLDKYSDVLIKSIKIYNRALTSEEIVANYIGDDYYLHANSTYTGYDVDKNIALRKVNCFNDNKQFEEGENGCVLPKVIISFNTTANRDMFNSLTNMIGVTGETMNTTVDCNIHYIDAANGIEYDSSTRPDITGTFIKLQGTTSTNYNRKNYDISFGKKVEGNKDVLFTPKYGEGFNEQWLPENQFTLKCDLIDSSHANNVGTANNVEDIFSHLNLELPPMSDSTNANRKDIKYAIKGFPCRLYIVDGTDGDRNVFYGIYMFDLGRTSYYNLGLKNYTFTLENENNCIVSDFTDISSNTVYAYEVSSNSNEDAGAFAQIDLDPIQASWTRRFPVSSTDNDYVPLQNAIKDIVYATNKPVYKIDDKGAVVTEDGVPVVLHPVDGTISENIDKFKASGWNKAHCATYLMCAYLFGMTDSLGKNLVVKTWNSTPSSNGDWYPTFYDMDTVLSLNNTGVVQWRSNVDIDCYGKLEDGTLISDNQNLALASTFTNDLVLDKSFASSEENGKGGGKYNTTKSRLWDALRSIDPYNTDNISNSYETYKGNYASLRTNNGVLTYNNLFSKYQNIIDSIGQMYYNLDAEIKYIPAYADKDGASSRHNLTFLHGTRELFTKRWLKHRLYYLDTLFFDAKNIPVGLEDNSPIRYALESRIDMGAAKNTYSFKTYAPIFVTHITENSGVGNTVTQLCDSYYFAPFTTSITANEINNNFYGSTLITYALGFNNRQTKRFTVAYAPSLLDINLSGASSLSEINVEKCKSLRSISIANCTGLIDQNSSLDLTACSNLQRVDISYSSILNLTLPAAGTLKELNASNTGLQSLIVSNQSMLETVDLTNCTNLKVIQFNNCSKLKKITITNSQLSTINFNACPKLEEVDINGNSMLTNIKFTDSYNVKTLNLSECRSASFAQYTGVEDKDNINALDLTGCKNLVSLNLKGCTAQVIKLNNQCKSIVNFNASNSNLIQTIYVDTTDSNHPVATFSKYLNRPSVDLSNLNYDNTSSYVNFYNNKYVQCVTGLKYKGSTSNMFNGCTKLYRLQGTIYVKDSAYRTFANITNSDFRLNDSYSGITSDNASSMQFTFNFNIQDTTTLSETFRSNYGVTIDDVQYILWSGSRLTSMSYVFNNTSLMKNLSDNVTLSSYNLFANMSNIQYCDGVFSSAGLKNAFPSNILSNCTSLKTCSNMFNGNSFTTLYSDFTNVLSNCRNLTDCSGFLKNNWNLTTGGNALDISKFFANNTLLKSCAGFLGFELTSGNYSTEDSYMDTVGRRATLTLSLDNSNKLFANNPELTDISTAFCKCNCIGVLSDDIFGGTKSTSSSSGTDGYSYPTKLTNVSFCFHDSNVTAHLKSNIFKWLTKLQSCAAFVSKNPNVDGDISTLANIFRYAGINLTNIRRFFEGTSVSGTIPSNLISENTMLKNINKLFQNSKVSNIPSLLFANNVSITNIDYLYDGCTSVSGSIPGDALKVTDSEGTLVDLPCNSAKGIFRKCGVTGTIPANLLQSLSRVTDISYMFAGCGSRGNDAVGLTGTIPANLISNCTQLVNVEHMFDGCYGLSFSVNEEGFKTTISETFFDNCPNLANVSGLFSQMRIYTIPATIFERNPLITDVSYMFYLSDMRQAKLYSDMFQKQNNITDITGFMALRSPSSPNESYGLTEFEYTGDDLSGIFKQYDSNTQTGQKRIAKVKGAFLQQDKLITTPADFWNWTNTPDSSYTASCYAFCTSLTDKDSIPSEYK